MLNIRHLKKNVNSFLLSERNYIFRAPARCENVRGDKLVPIPKEMYFIDTKSPHIRNVFPAPEKGAIMVDKELLDILCCPETKQDVTLVEGDVIAKINAKIKEGALKSRGGEVIKEKIDAGLLRKDKKFLYPIREDIPIMLIDEAIPFDQFEA